MNPKSLPLDLNSGGISAAFAGADEIPLTVRQARAAFLGVLRLKVRRNEKTVCLPSPLILWHPLLSALRAAPICDLKCMSRMASRTGTISSGLREDPRL